MRNKLLYLFLIILFQAACKINFDHRQVHLPASGSDTTYARDYTDSIIVLAAGPEYKKNALHHFLFGKNYREVWATPVRVRVLDLGTEAGGMEPVKIGGGKQTISLRVKAANGKEYNIRSVNKNPEKAVPKILRGTFLHNWVQDQISSSHPYGAFVVFPLARAVKVYHTDPQLVYVPHDPRLGKFIETAGGMMALMEIHADDDQSDMKRFGYAKNIIKTETMLKKMMKDNDNIVDQRAFLRARLLDMLLGDWDRKGEQFRWAEFEQKKGHLYKPVPEDRDQVFFKKEGLIPSFLTGKELMPYLQDFEKDLKNIKELNYIGHKPVRGVSYQIDKLFLSGLTKKDWLEIADSMQNELTDEVIDAAIKKWPENIYNLTGKEISTKLKSRRDQLTDAAETYYYVLAKQIYILGSNKNERLVVEKLSDDEISVIVYSASEDGEAEKKLYSRIINSSETKAVYFCSYAGNDSFIVDGEEVNVVKAKVAGVRFLLF